MRRGLIIFFLFLTIVISLLGCAILSGSKSSDAGRDDSGLSWKDVELTDVSSGKKFKISDFRGKQVLLEVFAVWCPTCKKQQDEIKELHKEIGNDFISVSVDTDPNEDKQKVLGHIRRYDYNWVFALDDNNFAKKIVGEFGINVVNAPSAPVVLIDKDQKTRLLRFGVKSKAQLKAEMKDGA